MRVAFASPLPPATSGIADYAAELLPHLAAEGLDLALYFEGSAPPAEPLRSAFPCRPARALVREAGSYDLVVYQMGNSAPHHAEIRRALLEVPGVAVLHEYVLHHLVRELTLAAGDGEAFVEEMRYAAGESGRRAAQRLLDSHFPVDPWRFPLFERAVDRSFAVGVHSESARRRIRASRPAAWVERLAFPVALDRLRPPTEAERRAARAELGLADAAPLLASYGFVTPHKRLGPALRAFARFRRERPAARFLVCGEVSPHYDFGALLAEVGEAGIVVTGRLALDAFDRALGAADLALNLRHPTGGETSAALVRLLARGVPSAVTGAGWFAELPDGVVAKVPAGEGEEELLLDLYRAAARDADLLAAMSRAARRYAEREHAPERSARDYAGLLARVAAARPEVAPAAPPLAPWRGDDPRIALLASVGADLADLGLGEGERQLLAAVAAEVAGLGWAPRRG
jgi:glycosyltransferase involved in cell wall biosynthesis